jgi:hypothetical protein
LLEEAHSGIVMDKEFSLEAMRQGQATHHGTKRFLKKLRIQVPLTDYKGQKALTLTLQEIFVATFFNKKLKDLKEEVVKHLQSNALALSDVNTLKKFKFTDSLPEWKFKHDENDFVECSLKEFDYGLMEKVVLENRVYKCDMCDSFWSKGRWDLRWTSCRACRKFSVAEDKPFDIEAGTSS